MYKILAMQIVRIFFEIIAFVQNEDCYGRNAKRKMRNAKCEMRNAKCGIRNAEYGIRNAEYGIRNVKLRMKMRNEE